MGPGTHLKNLILRWGIVQGDCECEEWEQRMNDWGPDGCIEHFAEIAAHLEDAARLRGMQAYTLLGQHKVLILLAIRKSRQDLRRYSDTITA